MGTLTPGAKLIYERVDDVVYAREVGSNERKIVGYAYERDPLDYRNYMSSPKEAQLWHSIRLAAQTNPAISDLLEKAKTLYYLSKECDAGHQERT
jgi:hypothetical protein